MTLLRIFLALSTIAIYLLTVFALQSQGLNYLAVAIADLQALNWRSQFDVDFIVYLILGSCWIYWREGASGRASLYAL